MAYSAKYKVVIITNGTTKYNVTDALLKLTLHENEGELAQRVELALANIQVNGQYLTGIIKVRDRVFIYAQDGERNEEVFRGYIWTRDYTSSRQKKIQLTCYDNLIFFQESEDYKFFSEGYDTKTVCGSICSSWAVKLNYDYESIVHPQLALRGTLSNIFTSDLLDKVKQQTGKRYVMRSTQDKVEILHVGLNKTQYKLLRNEGGNVLETSSNSTLNGVVTKVVILDSEGEDKQSIQKIIWSHYGIMYGNLQKVLSVSEESDLADTEKEARQIIKDHGTPKNKFSVTAVNIPWIRKGDKVYVSAGDMSGWFIVTGITHYGNDKTMRLEAEKA